MSISWMVIAGSCAIVFVIFVSAIVIGLYIMSGGEKLDEYKSERREIEDG